VNGPRTLTAPPKHAVGSAAVATGPPWALVACAIPAAAALLTRMRAIDLAYHVRTGELMLADGALVRTDPYTFTSGGEPWLDQQWGAQLLLAGGHRLGGWAGVALIYALATGIGFAVLYAHCRRRDATRRTAALLTLAAFVVSTGPAPRPQALAVPLFTATGLLLARRDAWTWLVPALALVWANVHGSFVLAPVLVALAVVEDVAERRRAIRSIGVLAATVVATCVTPFGPAVWSYAADIARNDTIRHWVTEWRPPTFTSASGAAFWTSGVVVLVVGFVRRRSVRAIDVVRLVVFFALAAPAVRGTLWWGLLAPTVVAGWLARRSEPAPTRRRLDAPAVVAAACVLALVPTAFLLRSGTDPVTGASRRLASDAPEVLVDAVLRSAPAGSHLLVYQPFASWFEYSLPTHPVMVDSRIELYPDRVWLDYGRAVAARDGWERILDHYGIRAVVLPPDATLRGPLERSEGWTEVVDGPAGSVFARDPAQSG
jgi:hypothetical protein